jgi:hypothetical protein
MLLPVGDEKKQSFLLKLAPVALAGVGLRLVPLHIKCSNDSRGNNIDKYSTLILAEDVFNLFLTDFAP